MPKMILVFGPPYSGKTTYARKLANIFQMHYIEGNNDVLESINEHHQDCVIDGFPEDVNKCKEFVEKYKNDFILVDIYVNTPQLIERAINKKICNKCNEAYSKDEIKCNICNEELEKNIIEETEIFYRLNNFNIIYEDIIKNFLEGTDKGVNIVPEDNSVELITNILSFYIILSEKNDFRIIMKLYN